jgi:hypothetical protein
MGAARNSGRGIGCTVAVVLGLSAGIPGTAAAQEARAESAAAVVEIVGDGGPVRVAGATVTINGLASAVDAAGGRVEINAEVSGPVRAAGAMVIVTGSVDGDLKAGGGVVDVNAGISGGAQLGAGVIRFDGTVAGSVEAGGASVEFGPASDIAGRLSAAAASLVVSGRIAGPVRLGGAKVSFNGEAAGNVTLEGGRIAVGPAAVIGGNLVVRSLTAPVIDSAARIAGETVIERPGLWWRMPSWAWNAILAALMAAGTVLAGLILIAAGRGVFEDALARATFRPFSSGLVAVATLVLLPVVAALLMATVIGLSFGIALLLLVPFLIVAGHAVVATCIGVWILDRRGEPRSAGRLILYLLAGAILVALVWLIPWVGPVLVGLAILVGAGAWMRSAWARLRQRRAVAS